MGAEKRKVILDCDTGLDDAIAIMLAVPHLDVLGITAVAGNCAVEDAARNSLKILEAVGAADDIGVYRGRACPLVAPLRTASDVHGAHGLGDIELPEPVHALQHGDAVDFIVRTAMATDGVTIIATGPLTNVAAALNREPRLAARLDEVIMMGGSATQGNVTSTAEFNILTDPEAAHRVFGSGARIGMVGLNLTRQCVFGTDEVARLRAIGTRASALAADITTFYARCSGSAGLTHACRMHDACAVAWAIEPALIRSAPMHVDVELSGALTRGMTVCDSRHLMGTDPKVDIEREPQREPVGEAPNAEVALELDFPGFFGLLSSTLAAYD